MENKERIIGIIQARMNSTRLPGKVLVNIVEKPMIWHIINRLKKVSMISKIVVSTTTDPTDEPLLDFCNSEKIPFYAGNINDITDRMYHTAKKFNASAFVKINGDCPLIDPKIIEKGIKLYNETDPKPDLVTNSVVCSFPEGMQYGLFNFETFETVWKTVRDPFWREYIFRYLIENPNQFTVLNLENKENLSHMRWTVDYKEDLDFVSAIYERLFKKNPFFSMDDILKLLKNNPQLKNLNSKYSSKDGLESYNNLKKLHEKTKKKT